MNYVEPAAAVSATAAGAIADAVSDCNSAISESDDDEGMPEIDTCV